jgi:hypothetical protein
LLQIGSTSYSRADQSTIEQEATTGQTAGAAQQCTGTEQAHWVSQKASKQWESIPSSREVPWVADRTVGQQFEIAEQRLERTWAACRKVRATPSSVQKSSGNPEQHAEKFGHWTESPEVGSKVRATGNGSRAWIQATNESLQRRI